MTRLCHKIQYSFTKNQRLLRPEEFKEVFDHPIKKIHSEHLLLFVKTRQIATHLSFDATSRLGLAITKKKVKLAVSRNRLKRLTREYFRLNAHRMIALDMVLIVKKNYTKDTDLHSEMVQIFDKLITLFPANSSDKSD